MDDDESFDDTESTPEPLVRPPPPTPLHASPHQVVSSSILEKTLFSFSVDDTLDEMGDSLPSLPPEPPSPVSRQPEFLYGDDGSSRQHHQRANSSVITNSASIRQPPIHEVHLNDEDDTFSECFEDRSLAHRTRRSLEKIPEQIPYQVEESASASLDDAPNPSPDDVARVHDSALQALIKLKEELTKANEKNKTLARERDLFKQQLEEQEHMAKDVQDESMSVEESLKSENQNLTREKDELISEKKILQAKLQREKKEAMNRKLAADNRQKELVKMKDELQEALANKEELSSDLGIITDKGSELEKENTQLRQQLKTRANTESTIDELRSQIDLKDNEISAIRLTLAEMKEEKEQESRKYKADRDASNLKLKEQHEASQKEVGLLKIALQEANDLLDKSRLEMQSKARSSLRISSFSPNSKSPATRTPTSIQFVAGGTSWKSSPSATLENSVADRLARMRDSAERAHLIRFHKREIARMKQDKEQEITTLVESHKQALREASEQDDSKLNRRIEGVKLALKEEFEEKLKQTESRHKQKFSEMQNEYMRKQEDTEESLRVALSKVVTATQQYERETIRREDLERTVDQLTNRIEEEKKELGARHREELEKQRVEWEMERDTVLTGIQKDCNLAFDGRKNSIPLHTLDRTSPKGVDWDFSEELAVETKTPQKSPSTVSTFRTPSFVTRYTDFDSVLRETEDLVESIM